MCAGTLGFVLVAPPPGELPPPPSEDGELFEDAGEEGGAGSTGESDGANEEKMFQEHLLRAQRAASHRRWRDAVSEYSAALELRDGDPEALRGRAWAYRKRTRSGRCPRQAIEDLTLLEVYDPRGLWLEERGSAVEWMAECGEGYSSEQLELAEVLAELPLNAPGRPPEIRVMAAELRAARARRVKKGSLKESNINHALTQLRRYRKGCEKENRIPSARALELEAELYVESALPSKAIESYRELIERYPAERERVERATRWVSELEIELAVRELEKAPAGKPTPEAEQAYRRGMAALKKGELGVAEAEFQRAVRLFPWYPRAHYHLGEVLARSDRFREAIAAFKTTIAMERYDHHAHMALGLLYKKEFLGSEDVQARRHLDLALGLRPDLYVLHFHLGELYARSDKEQAREHFRRFIDASSLQDPLLPVAREALRDLEREVEDHEPFVPPPVDAQLRLLDPELHRLISEAHVLGAEHGEWDRAEKLLLEGRERWPEEPELLNMLARVGRGPGRPGWLLADVFRAELGAGRQADGGARAPGHHARGFGRGSRSPEDGRGSRLRDRPLSLGAPGCGRATTFGMPRRSSSVI